MNPHKSPSRLGVEHYFNSRPEGHTASRAEIEAVVGEECYRAIHNLTSVNWLKSVRIKGQGVRYTRTAFATPAHAKRAKLTAATNGPGFRISGPVGSIECKTPRITNGTMGKERGDYMAPELQPPAGITPDRLAFLSIPSRFGKELRYRDGRSEVLA